MVVIIEKEDPNFPGVKFALKALLPERKHEQREHVTHAKVEKGHIFCTDGARIHKFELVDLNQFKHDGIYRVLANTAKRIVLMRTDCDICHDVSELLNKIEECTTSCDANFLQNYDQAVSDVMTTLNGTVIHMKYIEDLRQFDFQMSAKDGESPIFFTNENATAAIMPMRRV